MAERRNRSTRAIGNALVHLVPRLLSALSAIGTAAMLWVGGGILLHGLEELRLIDPVAHFIHDLAHRASAATGGLGGLTGWLITAVAGAIVGLLVGGIIAAIVRRFTKRPEELIVD
jgi:predicted DNA repair protein MutK